MSDHSDDGLRDRVRQLEQLVEQQAERIAELESGRDTGGWSRRSVLASAATAAGIGALTGRVRAAPSYGSASGQIGTSSDPVSDVIAQSLRVNSARIDGVLELPNAAADQIFLRYSSSAGSFDSRVHDIVVKDLDSSDAMRMRFNGGLGEIQAQDTAGNFTTIT